MEENVSDTQMPCRPVGDMALRLDDFSKALCVSFQWIEQPNLLRLHLNDILIFAHRGLEKELFLKYAVPRYI